ncbi:MAG: NAD(+) synthase [Clostridia bacterium]|nr:NAD(+) synthase [Clostridia bacterium]
MRDGFVRLASATPAVKVADCVFNANEIKNMIFEAAENNAAAIIFPELAITGYTCGDLFKDRTLQAAAQESLKWLIEETAEADILVGVGMPVPYMGALYNCVAVFKSGVLLGLPAKKNIPNYSEFYERRHYTPAHGTEVISFCGFDVPMGENIVFTCENNPDFTVGFEVCEDVWVACPPAVGLTKAGATVIMNASCSDEIIGKADYRRMMLSAFSGRTLSAYVYADSGFGESTQDMVFAGHRLITENGSVITESDLFTSGISYGDVDVQRLVQERRRMNTWEDNFSEDIFFVSFDYEDETFINFELERYIDPRPFVPGNAQALSTRCKTILQLQYTGLATRLKHIGSKTAVVGLSGGLDSTLALLVMVEAFDSLGLSRDGIKAVSMPCFGTTGRTKGNAQMLAEALGVNFREIPIQAAVNQHFADIGHNPEILDVTYENSQARERTQLLMDIANKENGIVVGTGDLSELALGWATYNGDHMSMYAVNASIPKTLVRHLVKYVADTNGNIKDVLYDILDTPVSPELLPPKDGEISQKTEDLVGPYELHDFFLYYMLRFGFTPDKIYRMAINAFDGMYDFETIKKWLRTFYRRFFQQQFKRSCLPDGPKVGSVTLSPRGDFRMPTDASSRIWMDIIDKL